jgi:uncharacterized protein (TIGR02246 family)
MPSPAELRTLVATYVEAVNTRVPADVAALFTEDARQADPASAPANVGRTAIAAFFEQGIATSDTWTFEATTVHTCASTVAIDFTIAVHSGDTDMHIEGIEVFHVREDGLFESVDAYWDESDLTIR